MADAGTPSRGLGKWVVAGLVLATGAVGRRRRCCDIQATLAIISATALS